MQFGQEMAGRGVGHHHDPMTQTTDAPSGQADGADAASLRLALLVLAPTGFWAVWHFWLAARTVVEDQIRAIGYTTA